MSTAQKSRVLGIELRLEDIWEECLRALPERPPKPRDYIYASELDGSFRDRYLKMWAHPPSNPINSRARLKMLAGKFFEDVVGQILTGCGLLKERQLAGRVELKGMLSVSGKKDFVFGGLIDWDEAASRAEQLKQTALLSQTETAAFILYMTDCIIPHFRNILSVAPAMEMVMECKSVSGFVFGLIEKNGQPRRGHDLQTLHYLLSDKEIQKGIITYISREDCMLKEIGIEKTPELLKRYSRDVETMTDYYRASGNNYLKNVPPPDPEVIFEQANWSFRKSNFVEYSPFLTYTYGYRSIDDFKFKWDKPLSQFNRVFKRVVKGDNLTAANRAIIEEAKKVFPEWDKLVAEAKAAGAFDRPEETEEES